MSSSRSQLTVSCSSLCTEILTLFVGPKRQKILIHWTMLQKAARVVRGILFFKRRFQGATIDEPTKVAYLPKEDGEAFELFCFWIYRKSLPELDYSLQLLEIRKARVISNVKLYQLATKFGISGHQTATGRRIEWEFVFNGGTFVNRIEILESNEVLEFLREADTKCFLRNYILKRMSYHLLNGSSMDGDWISTFTKSSPTVAIDLLQTFKTSLEESKEADSQSELGIRRSFHMHYPLFGTTVLPKLNSGPLQDDERVIETSQRSGELFGRSLPGGAQGGILFGEDINTVKDTIDSNSVRSASSITTLPNPFGNYSAEVIQFSKNIICNI